jgi:membrane protein
LVACKLIVELNVDEDEDEIYQPARDINSLTTAVVVEALEVSGQNYVPGLKIQDNLSPLAVVSEKTL